jgi:hypothetical protein
MTERRTGQPDAPPADQHRTRLRVITRRHGRRTEQETSGEVRLLIRGAYSLHWFRKGYYLDVPADYVCMICGQWATEDDLDPAANPWAP